MVKNKKLLAGLMALTVLIMLLFSVFFITSEARHKCIGENCPICHEVQTCFQVLNTLGTGGFSTVVAVLGTTHFLVICVIPVFHRIPSHTLVSLKVKLTN